VPGACRRHSACHRSSQTAPRSGRSPAGCQRRHRFGQWWRRRAGRACVASAGHGVMTEILLPTILQTEILKRTMEKPLPIITPDNTPFWEGCRDGQLLLQRCTVCAAWRYPPAPVCPRCAATTAAWTPTSRAGRIQSFVIYYRAFHPAYAAEVPYAVALVEL